MVKTPFLFAVLLPFLLTTCLFLSSGTLYAQIGKYPPKNKMAVIEYVDQNENELISWSKQIWEYAEPSFSEIKSSQFLINILRNEGFTITENLGGLSTVFMASYGNAKPVIGLYGEYDADPSASNKVVPRKEELTPGGYGHGGNHNLLAVGSLGACLAIKSLIKQGSLNCTIRYYGSAAEGTAGVRACMARDGYFNDLDFSLYWHPSPGTWASTSIWDALIEFELNFAAKKLNVINEPIIPANTLNAFELFVPKMRSLRKQITEGVKLNYAIQQWKGGINQIPDTVKIGMKIQCAHQQDALKLLNEIKKIAQDISHETNVSNSITIRKAMHQFLPNVTAMRIVHANMELLGPITYTSEERDFVKELQHYLKNADDKIEDKIPAFSDQSRNTKVYGYASDIGEASWIAPEVYFSVKTLPPVYMHTWQGAIFSGHSIGHKGMLQASKILAMTIVDYVENKTLQDSIQKDFRENKRGYSYHPIIDPAASCR